MIIALIKCQLHIILLVVPTLNREIRQQCEIIVARRSIDELLLQNLMIHIDIRIQIPSNSMDSTKAQIVEWFNGIDILILLHPFHRIVTLQ